MPDPHDDEADVVWLLHREMIPNLREIARFVIDGEPVSKARARFTGKGYAGRAYTPEKTRLAEERVAWAARAAGVRTPDPERSFGVFCKFFCGTWQRRDVDNMTKLILDGLNGIAWKDDAQVTEISASVHRGQDHPRTHVMVYETLLDRPPTAPCEVCGVPVRQYKSQPNRYCSREHAAIGQQARVPLSCTRCGTVYELPRARAARVKTPFCSETCRKAHQTVTGACEQCGTRVTRPKSQTKGHLFCSVACTNQFRVGLPRGGAA